MTTMFAAGESDVLLVVDIQNDFCPGGQLAVPRGEEVVPSINGIAKRFEHVVLTQDWHPPGHQSFASSHPGERPFEIIEVTYGPQILWPDHCVQGTPGAQFRNDLQIPHAELVLRKGFRPISLGTPSGQSALMASNARSRTGALLRRRRGVSIVAPITSGSAVRR
jgi:nicotinamidase/pyrazinamidase